MELVAPAGNFEKLKYAYEYGADAAYIGLKRFSLRVKADNFYEDEYKAISELKAKYPGKKLFCALNITFHNRDIDNFLKELDYFKSYPIDSFIIQDIGMVNIIKKHFPNAALHLSTQANCINREAVKMYKDLGFKRVVLGREASLAEIREIKDTVPEMELEVFAHGAMCISYSGRCLMSAYLTGRSANAGWCSHSCRWNFNLSGNNDFLTEPLTNEEARAIAQSGKLFITEHERPNEHFPIFEGEDFTAILSSKDLCMVDHLDQMKEAGVDSLKIEGRMKSLYYVAMTVRAYRKAIDALQGKISPEEAAPYIQELYKAPHREFATGFFFRHEDADKTTVGESASEFELVATIGKELSREEATALQEKAQKAREDFDAELAAMHPDAKKAKEKDLELHPEKVPHPLTKDDIKDAKLFVCSPLNRIDSKTWCEFVGPNNTGIQDSDFVFVDSETGMIMDWTSHNHDCLLLTKKDIAENWIMRTKSQNKLSGSNKR